MNEIEQILLDAREVLTIESKELLNVRDSLDENISRAVLDIIKSSGKTIIVGMGKSGIIGRKIAASLSSTGTSSFFVHPGEAFHGDLGMFEKNDIVILLSNSGETDEVLKLLSFFQYQGNKTISITGCIGSTLATNTTHHILCKVEKEACPLQLAPTSSTTAALAIGDAIVVALIKLRKFQPENFARFHPGGSLGRRLLLKVEDIMIDANLPVVNSETSVIDAIHIISKSGYGLAVQIDSQGKVEGLITDGDVRRSMEIHTHRIFELNCADISIKEPKSVTTQTSFLEVEELLSSNRISCLLVVNSDFKLIGLVRA